MKNCKNCKINKRKTPYLFCESCINTSKYVDSFYPNMKKESKLLLIENLKKCSICNDIKNINEFGKNSSISNSTHSWCTKCFKNKRKEQRKNPKYKYKELLLIAPNTDITFEEFEKIVIQNCYYCGNKNLTLGLDRIIPKSQGGEYLMNNVVSCCKICNVMKLNHSVEEFILHIRQIFNNNFK